MNIDIFREKAVQGGWKPIEEKCHHKLMHDENGCPFGFHYPSTDKMLLDAYAWQAVGKVEGWNSVGCVHFGKCLDGTSGIHCAEWEENNCDDQQKWLYNMHRMIDALAEVKTLEEYIATL